MNVKKKTVEMRELEEAPSPGCASVARPDTPVAPPRPLEEIWIATNRFCEDGEVIAPAERITVQEALRMKTSDAAHVIGLDALIGSIEAGKIADFTGKFRLFFFPFLSF